MTDELHSDTGRTTTSPTLSEERRSVDVDRIPSCPGSLFLNFLIFRISHLKLGFFFSFIIAACNAFQEGSLDRDAEKKRFLTADRLKMAAVRRFTQ